MKALLPAPDASLGLAGSPHDLIRPRAVGSEQDDLSPPNMLLYGVAILDESFKPMPIDWRNGDGFSCAHRADSHAKPKRGIPNGT
jgi:hypothetical protein